MPAHGVLDNVPIERLQEVLNHFGTLERAGEFFGVSGRTVARAIDGKLEPFQCWRPATKTVDATFTATVTTKPVDSEGQAQ